MDGNGRWAKERGLPRTEGHKRGEHSLFDVIMGAIELGIPYLSAYAFSTENWRRSPDEVRFLMGFNRDVIRRRRDQLHEMGVRVRWAGRRPRLWRSVISELEDAERMTAGNSVLTLQFCVNYGGRAEIADAAAKLAADAVAGRIRPDRIDEKVFARYLDEPGIPEVDLFVRSSGEQRNWCSSTRCSPTSTGGTCGGPARSTRAGTAGTAAPCRTGPRYLTAWIPAITSTLATAATRSSRAPGVSLGQDTAASQPRNAATRTRATAPTGPGTASPATSSAVSTNGTTQTGSWCSSTSGRALERSRDRRASLAPGV
jgi:undecaprenyl diphosphate synthase